MKVGSELSAEALAHAGFDLALPLRLRAGKTRLSWDALSYSNRRDFRWVGNAATCWQEAPTARLVHLDTAPDLPGGAILDLVRAAVCEAADRGATVVYSDLPVPNGAVLVFRRAKETAERLDTDLLVQTSMRPSRSPRLPVGDASPTEGLTPTGSGDRFVLETPQRQVGADPAAPDAAVLFVG
jgi:hypothetical protein